MKSDQAWLGSVTGFLIFVLFVGGSSNVQPTLVFLLRILSIALLLAGLYRLRHGIPGTASAPAFLIMALSVGLLLLHLLPLPPVIWQSLPGREFVSAAIAAADTSPKWMPLSLSPPLTRLSLLALLPPMAMFTASLTLSPRERWIPIVAILAFVVASILLGLVQRLQGPGTAFSFYEESNLGAATFANRNSFAALLYVAIPFIWALALRTLRDGSINRYVIVGFTSLMLILIVLGLAIAGSRAGILLGMLALLGSSFLALGQQRNTAAQLGSRFAIPALIVAFLLIGQFGMVAILRLAEFDPVSDIRMQLFGTTLRAAWSYFPVGSGFGTFVPIYTMHETPSVMIDTYANHAHNDWLELWLEGGVPVALVIAAFLYWYVSNSIGLWRAREQGGSSLLPKAATLATGLLLIHSLVDYPLRAPALTSLFGILAALMASAPISSRVRSHIQNNQAPTIRSAAQRTSPFFAPRNARPLS